MSQYRNRTRKPCTRRVPVEQSLQTRRNKHFYINVNLINAHNLCQCFSGSEIALTYTLYLVRALHRIRKTTGSMDHSSFRLNLDRNRSF